MSAGAERAGAGGGGRGESWPRPRVVISACLELEACRYNGQSIRAAFVPRLAQFSDLLAVCPEVEIGLGVPRSAIRLVGLGEVTRLIQPATGRDLTDEMERFSDSFLAGVGEVDGFLLKSRSPSCGPKDVKRYGEDGIPRGERAPGMFAAAAARRFPCAALEDEGRLTNYRLRHHFLSRLFQSARLRALPGSASALGAFHASSKLLLLAHSELGMRRLGRIVANPDRLPLAEVRRRYQEEFATALARPPRPGPTINALMHALGHFGDLLPAEKQVFLDALEEYRTGRATFDALRSLIRAWVARYGLEWIAGQTLLQPYPAELHDLADSAGGARAA
jgi:uncharacterized protein YbgA (DUF1722 family)/uncharacterized protein YbbK (DUF523 family)